MARYACGTAPDQLSHEIPGVAAHRSKGVGDESQEAPAGVLTEFPAALGLCNRGRVHYKCGTWGAEGSDDGDVNGQGATFPIADQDVGWAYILPAWGRLLQLYCETCAAQDVGQCVSENGMAPTNSSGALAGHCMTAHWIRCEAAVGTAVWSLPEGCAGSPTDGGTKGGWRHRAQQGGIGHPGGRVRGHQGAEAIGVFGVGMASWVW